MKKVFIYLAIIIAAITTILIQASTIRELKKPRPATIVRDTTWLLGKDSIVYKPGKVITKDTTIYVDVPVDVDTAKILTAYYAKNVYIDTLKLRDSLGHVIVEDTISQNVIFGRRYNAHVKQMVITNTITLPAPPFKPVTQVYIGGELNYIDKDIQLVSAGLLLKTKIDDIIGVNAGVIRIDNKVRPFFGGKLYWKISFRK